jgi:hypothetical protein
MSITEADLTQARAAWADALVSISKTYEESGIDAARVLASDILDAAYGYNLGPVLFKPTLASGEKTFRPTKEGALAYFVGHDDSYPLDNGFGIAGWRSVDYDSSAHFIDGDVGMWMGWAKFTDKDGKVVTVNKTFGYKKDDDGVVRIVLHHSSLPYEPE